MKGELKNEIQTTIKNQQTALMSPNNAFQNTLQNNLQTMLNSFFQAQPSPSGTLPSNTIPNLKGEMKAITTGSGVAYEGPSNPTKPFPKKVVEQRPSCHFEADLSTLYTWKVILKSYVLELLGFPSDDFSSGNPTSTSEPFTLEEIDAFLYDKSISLEVFMRL
ncbi:hypothetical protein Tco_0591720 [Tanacetum coccineum]